MPAKPLLDRSQVVVTQAEPEDMSFIAQELCRLKLDQENLDFQQFLVARQGKKIAGFGRIKAEEGFYEMASLAVLEDYRGQGLGMAIARRLLALCPGHTVYLVTDIPKFFEKLGFKIAEEVPPRLLQKAEEFCAGPPFGPVVPMALKRFTLKGSP